MPDLNVPSSIRDVVQESVEALNVQRQLEQSLSNQANTLEQMLGISNTLKNSFVQRLSRQIDLGKSVKNIEKQIQDQKRHTSTLTDEAKRAESKLVEDGLAQQLSAYSKELAMLKQVNTAAIGPLLYFLGQTWELFKSLDKAAADFRLTMGFTRSTASDLRKIAEQTAIGFMHVGVNIEGAYTAILGLSKEMGSAHAISKELVKTTAVLKAQLGISEEASAGFLRNMAAIAGSSMEAQQNMAFMAGALSNAAGVPLPSIMKDIATKSSTTLTMMSRLPGQVIRAAVELRKMGTDLDRASKSSSEILNFTESVQAEMEASVLLGHSINLQKARELAYNRDLVGSTKEILKLAKQNNFAHGMDRFQMEAFARATGKSVDELLSMVQAEKQWNDAKNSQDPKIRARIDAAEKMKSLSDAMLKDEGKKLEMFSLQQSNQARLASISQKWSQIMAKLGEVFLPIIDKALGFVADNLETIVGVSAGIWGIWKLIRFDAVAWGQRIGMVFARTSAFFGGLMSRFGGLIKLASRIVVPLMFAWNIFKEIKKILGDKQLMGTEGFLAFNLKLIPRASGAIIRALWTTINDLFIGLPGLIANGIGAAGNYIFGKLITPFKMAWDWLGKTFLGNSPSELGLRMVNGIASVAGTLFDTLTAPWRKFFAWVLDKVPGMSKYATGLREGMGGVLSRSVELKASELGGEKITPTANKVPGTTNQPSNEVAAAVAAAVEFPEKVFGEMLNELKSLNASLQSGKIGIYLDGQLLSATLARQTEFRGGFGVNKI